jgi:hypothetical protein
VTLTVGLSVTATFQVLPPAAPGGLSVQ